MKRPALLLLAFFMIGIAVVGYMQVTSPDVAQSNPNDNSPPDSKLANPDFCIKSWSPVEDFQIDLAVFETVFWDPRDTESLRLLIRDRGGELVRGKSVFEIGTGSGLLSLCCLASGADHVVATDVNEAAIACANFNASRLQLNEALDTRLVSLENSSAFAVIKVDEKFDLIISNPPWVDRKPNSIDEHALYDDNFALMTSLFAGLRDHLNPDGKLLLAYGCVDAIKTIQRLADEHDFEAFILDDRNLDDLPEEFLPGMLIEIRLK